MARTPPPAASGRTGFFQAQPDIPNVYAEDAVLARATTLFLPPVVAGKTASVMTAFADEITTPAVYDAMRNAEHDLPYLSGSGYSSFGHPEGQALVTSAGWRALQDLGIRSAIVATGYDTALGASARVVQYIKLHLWTGSACVVSCPSAMQDGAVNVLLREVARGKSHAYESSDEHIEQAEVFERALGHLLSLDPRDAWTSGQWMTERPGGSDVSGTETRATYAPAGDAGELYGQPLARTETDIDGLPLGPWVVDGFKWFSSATDCGCVLLLAKTPKGGLSCFFAPTRKLVKGQQVMNGISIQRLKNKMGTKALPTAEVEVKAMRAWLVGDEGRGVPVISSLLNVTRLYNAASATGFLGRGLSIARAFARVRVLPSLPAPNNTLYTVPRFCKTLAGVSLAYRADTLLGAFVAALVGASEAAAPGVGVLPASLDQCGLLMRVLTPVAKARTAKNGIHGLQECMEALGGVGYMENQENPEMNVARLFRDANVLSIWEGTTDVLATDTVKVFTGKTGAAVAAALDAWLLSTLDKITGFDTEKAAIRAAWAAFRPWLQKDKAELLALGREVLKTVGDVVCATLLLVDATRDGDPVATEAAHRFVETTTTFNVTPRANVDWRETAKWDQAIAFPAEKVAHDEARAKSAKL